MLLYRTIEWKNSSWQHWRAYVYLPPIDRVDNWFVRENFSTLYWPESCEVSFFGEVQECAMTYKIPGMFFTNTIIQLSIPLLVPLSGFQSNTFRCLMRGTVQMGTARWINSWIFWLFSTLNVFRSSWETLWSRSVYGGLTLEHEHGVINISYLSIYVSGIVCIRVYKCLTLSSSSYILVAILWFLTNHIKYFRS